MDALSRLWPLPLGFLAGLIAVPMLFRWLLLVLAAIGKLPANLGTAAQRPRKVGVVLAIVHPVPWLLLLLLAFGGPRILASPFRVEWTWFFAGAIGAPLANGVLVYLAVRRARSKRRRDARP